jgi:hypothetical protein
MRAFQVLEFVILLNFCCVWATRGAELLIDHLSMQVVWRKDVPINIVRIWPQKMIVLWYALEVTSTAG